MTRFLYALGGGLIATGFYQTQKPNGAPLVLGLLFMGAVFILSAMAMENKL